MFRRAPLVFAQTLSLGLVSLVGCGETEGGDSSTSASTETGSGTGGETGMESSGETTSGESSESSGDGDSATEESTSGDGDATSGDGDGDGDGDLPCMQLDETQCEARQDCAGLGGQALERDSTGQACWGPMVFVYCTSAEEACLPATQTVCRGQDTFMAWSTCALPDGWTPCNDPGVSECGP